MTFSSLNDNLIKFTGIDHFLRDTLNSKNILKINSFEEFLNTVAIGLVFQFFIYFSIAGFLEYTHPAPKSNRRISNIKKEIFLCVFNISLIVIISVFWMWKIDQLSPFYNYYEQNEFTLWNLFMNIIVYTITMDTWFYWTHIFLHQQPFYKYIHSIHHQFNEPTAFCLDAFHPIEALIQGPLGHYLCTLFYPMHSLVLQIMGIFSVIFAIFAHDGRAFDINGHIIHHYYKSCNYGLFFGFWDYLCGTKFGQKKFHYTYVPSWQREIKNE